MRWILALMLVGCDVDDLGKSTKPNREEYCTSLANQQEQGWTTEAYNRCLYGRVTGADAGAD